MPIRFLYGLKAALGTRFRKTGVRPAKRRVQSLFRLARGVEPLESRHLLSASPLNSFAGDVVAGWALGGQAFDDARSIAVDSQQNVIVAGSTFSGGWTSAGYDTTWGGEGDAYVAKFTRDGQHLWSTYLGGAYDDGITALAVDEEGFIYVAGWTRSSGWVSGGYDTSYGGSGDGFVVKLSPAGEYLWATYLGGTNWDAISALCLTPDGKIAVAGTTSSSGWIRKGFDATYNGGTFDAFAAVLTRDGEFLWSTYLGGTGWDYGYAVSTTAEAVYVAGKTSSANWVSQGFDVIYAGGNFDGYLVRLSLAGQHVWSTYLGGTGEDTVASLVSDSGIVWAAGSTTSADLPFASVQEGQDGWDGFVVAVQENGQPLWGTRLGGTATDQATAIARAPSSGLIVVGTTTSDGWLSGGRRDVPSGESDGFIARLCATSGAVLWGSYFGGAQEDVPLAVTLGTNGSVLVAGMTDLSDWLPDEPWGNLGEMNAFVAVITANRAPEITAFSADRLTIAAPTFVELRVLGISDGDGPADVSGVLFYRDTNGDGLWNEPDRLLGETRDIIDGKATWILEITEGAWPLGQHTVFAVAYDHAGQTSHPAVLNLTVTKLVELGPVDYTTVTENEFSAGVVVYHFLALHDALLILSLQDGVSYGLQCVLYDGNPLEDPAAIPLGAANLCPDNRTASVGHLNSGEDAYLLVRTAAEQSSWIMVNLYEERASNTHIFWDSLENDAFSLLWENDPIEGVTARVTINSVDISFALQEAAETQIVFHSQWGIDTMTIEGTPADDSLQGWLDRVVFFPGGFGEGETGHNVRVEVNGFDFLHAYGRGGNDRASIYDQTSTAEATAKIKLKSEPQFNHVKVIGPQTFIRVKLFETVEVFADGAGDQALFYDSTGDDFFIGFLGYSQMTGPGYEVKAYGFPFVTAYSKNGGNDQVRFVDSVMKDEFSLKPHKSEVFDQVTGGAVYRIVARGFDRVQVEAPSATGGRDKAAIWDTIFSDNVEVFGDRLTFTRTVSRPEVIFDIRGVEFVKIRPSSGGDDRVLIRIPPEIELVIGDGWQIL